MVSQLIEVKVGLALELLLRSASRYCDEIRLADKLIYEQPLETIVCRERYCERLLPDNSLAVACRRQWAEFQASFPAMYSFSAAAAQRDLDGARGDFCI